MSAARNGEAAESIQAAVSETPRIAERKRTNFLEAPVSSINQAGGVRPCWARAVFSSIPFSFHTTTRRQQIVLCMPLPPENLRLATLDLNLQKSLEDEKATAKNLLDCARKTELGLRKKIADHAGFCGGLVDD